MRRPKLLDTANDYSWPLLRADALAGVSVALVALPLCIAIAIASGSTPFVGLVTAIVGGFVISATSGSRVQIGGPTGAFIVVVYGVIQDHGMDGLIVATIMAGILLIVAGFFRAGRLIALVPEPVIDGFTIGIAGIIAASQFQDALGLSAGKVPADMIPKLEALWAARATLSLAALGVTAATVAAILLLRRWRPRWPVLVIAVGAASLAVLLFHLPVDTVGSRFGALPSGFPAPHWPEVTTDRIVALLPSAITIAFLAGVESLLSAIVADRMFDGRHRPSAELLAQGYANVVTPLFGGLPVTGAIARTATNVRAGGRTPVAGMVHAAVILIVVLAAGGLAGALALPALAAVLLVTAYNMAEPEKWREHAALPRDELLLLLVTLLLTIFADLTIAIGTGVALGFILRWWKGRGARLWTPRER
ncbi:SulP family inorganic anion transporter [Sphingopyxis sp. LC363]|jgi:SulP family sulfate permease|uniref:SulP family inorganic anion transporter n=1 Tax=Sphingopyxis sp. LC363 TaxID=1120705 RepID=UPI00050EC276|nr:SulP family inorganic anion transporter [Sphingopyxis sp. LC363]KGB58987.1 Sulfate permease [Sphingopyxis sp. LC363]